MPPWSGLQIRPQAPHSPRPKECPREERPFERRVALLLVQRAEWIQEIPAGSFIPLIRCKLFSAVCLIRGVTIVARRLEWGDSHLRRGKHGCFLIAAGRMG